MQPIASKKEKMKKKLKINKESLINLNTKIQTNIQGGDSIVVRNLSTPATGYEIKIDITPIHSSWVSILETGQICN